jgi:hypothetical protein
MMTAVVLMFGGRVDMPLYLSLSLCITAQEVQTFRLSDLRKSKNSSMNLYLEEIFLLEPIKN